jgi:anti-anti-sigma factor
VADAPEFRIETLHNGSATTIRLAGELDSATHPELLGHFERAAADAGAIVLDLEEVSFIDSAGLRAIILIEQEARERSVSLTVVSPPESVTDLLHLTGVADRVTLASRAGAGPVSTQFTDRVELELRPEPASPGRARAELRQVIGGRLSKNDAATATLLVSELVTNAVIHSGQTAGASVGVRITTYADRLRVEVTDYGPGFDLEQLPPSPRATGGHGLLVVRGLASRWGTERAPVDGHDRFCVWFELDGGAGDAVAGRGAETAVRAGDAVAGRGAETAAGAGDAIPTGASDSESAGSDPDDTSLVNAET